MSETIINPEYIKDLRTPAERLEQIFLDIRDEAKEVADRKFDDAYEATVVNDAFLHSLNERVGNTMEYASIPVRLSGTDVRIPEYDTRSAEDSETGDKGLAIIVPKDNCLRRLDPFESYVGAFEGFMGSVVESKAAEGKYQIAVNALFNLGEVDSNPVNIQGSDIAIMDIAIRKRALVEVGGDSSVVPVELLALRRRYELADRIIAQDGLVKSLFMKQVRNLQRAFHTEHERDFKPLDKVSIFRSIGSLGAEYARRGEDMASIVSSVIVEAIGPERYLKIGHTELLEGVVEVENHIGGTISHVIMPEDADDETQPMLVLSHRDGQKAIEFESITSLKF